MINKKLLLVAAWYIVWGLVASHYNKKSPEQLKEDLKVARDEWKKDLDVYLTYFIETHKNLLDNFKSEVFSEKNKELFNEKKQELFNLLDDYKIKGEELLVELRDKWSDYSIEIKDKLEVLYKEKITQLDSLRDQAPQKIDEIKTNLTNSFEKFKKDIEEKVNKK